MNANKNQHELTHTAETAKHVGISRRELLSGGALLAATGALISVAGCSSRPNNPATTTSVPSGTAPKLKTGANPAGTYQLTKTYPVPIEEKSFDDSLMTNSFDSFLSFTGQGVLYVQASDPASCMVAVNGTPIPLKDAKADDWAEVDISGITVNGDNKLEVHCLAEGVTCKVSIPYPVIIDDTKAWEKNDTFALLDHIIEGEIKHGFTSAQLVVVKNGRMIKQSSWGLCNSYAQDGTRLTDGAQVGTTTMYDLASNTKMYATNFAIQKLVSEEKLDVTKKVSEYIPEFKDAPGAAIPGKNELTIADILKHQAGFPPDPQYHNIDYDPAQGKTVPGSRANEALYTQSRDEALQKIIETPLDYAPGTKTKYSDVDYMLLGFIVEKITGKRLDEYVSEVYYKPLGLEHITFNPLENGFSKDDCAATELNGNTRDGLIHFDNIRTQTIQGQVHDEKAFYTMGGVSGHAGLFASATDLATLLQVIVNRGGYGEHQFFSADTLYQFIKPKDINASYGLGWRRKAHTLYNWAFSPIADPTTVGHTGWTGTLTVIDPVQNITVALLTNTKNSPVLNNKENPNDFVGNHYLTGGYGLPATLSFAADASDKTVCAANLLDAIIAKYQLIVSKKDYNTKPDRGALAALVDALDLYKDVESVKMFKKGDLWSKISAEVEGQ